MAKMKRMLNRRGLSKLSIGIFIFLLLFVLILVFIKTRPTGANYNVSELNKNLEADINRIFKEMGGGRTLIYLPNNQANVKEGQVWGIAFAIKNNLTGNSDLPSTFDYNIKASSIEQGCNLSTEQADSYILYGQTGGISISPSNNPTVRLIKIELPADAPLCKITYDLIVTNNKEVYDKNSFIVKIIK